MWYFNRNTIFSRINIILFCDAGNVTFKCIFSWQGYLCFFYQKASVIFVTFMHIHRKQHISMYFMRKIILQFASKEKIYFREKEILSSQILQKRSCSSTIFWKDHLFRTFEENIISPCMFLRKIKFPFLSKKKCHIFGKKKYHLSS